MNYLTREEIQELFWDIIEESGIHGRDGRDGVDGASIRGPKGEKGDDGASIRGPRGEKGDTGETVYISGSGDEFNSTNIVNVLNVIDLGWFSSKGKAPALDWWEVDDLLSISYLVPEQSQNYNADVYATDESGQIYDLGNDGVFRASADHQQTFFNLPSNTIQAGNLFGERGVFEAYDVTGVDGQFDFHVELIGAGSSEVIHDFSMLISL